MKREWFAILRAMPATPTAEQWTALQAEVDRLEKALEEAHMRTGDVLVATVDHTFALEQADMLREFLAQYVPVNCPVMIIGQSVTLSVIRPMVEGDL